jgi:hypothetical protein
VVKILLWLLLSLGKILLVDRPNYIQFSNVRIEVDSAVNDKLIFLRKYCRANLELQGNELKKYQFFYLDRSRTAIDSRVHFSFLRMNELTRLCYSTIKVRNAVSHGCDVHTHKIGSLLRVII